MSRSRKHLESMMEWSKCMVFMKMFQTQWLLILLRRIWRICNWRASIGKRREGGYGANLLCFRRRAFFVVNDCEETDKDEIDVLIDKWNESLIVVKVSENQDALPYCLQYFPPRNRPCVSFRIIGRTATNNCAILDGELYHLYSRRFITVSLPLES